MAFVFDMQPPYPNPLKKEQERSSWEFEALHAQTLSFNFWVSVEKGQWFVTMPLAWANCSIPRAQGSSPVEPECYQCLQHTIYTSWFCRSAWHKLELSQRKEPSLRKMPQWDPAVRHFSSTSSFGYSRHLCSQGDQPFFSSLPRQSAPCIAPYHPGSWVLFHLSPPSAFSGDTSCVGQLSLWWCPTPPLPLLISTPPSPMALLLLSVSSAARTACGMGGTLVPRGARSEWLSIQ